MLGRQTDIFGTTPGDRLIFEEQAGLVDAQLLRDGNEVSGAKIRAPGKLQVGGTIADKLVAGCVQIDPVSILHTTHAPTFASVGLPFAFAEVDGLETLGKARPNAAVFAEAAAHHKEDKTGFSLFPSTRARPKNPGTSAPACSRRWTISMKIRQPAAPPPLSAPTSPHCCPQPTQRVEVTIEQGVEMGRRSLIGLEVKKSAGSVTDVFLSGRCVSVMRGEVDILDDT